MSVSPVTIVGFSSTDFVPGYVGDTKLSAGRLTGGGLPKRVLVVGNKTAAGSDTADSSPPRRLFNEDDADTYFGIGSEVSRMAYAALLVPGSEVWAIANADPGGTAATLTVTFTGTAGSAGTYSVWICGVECAISITSGDTVTAMATAVTNAINAQLRLPVTAVSAVGVVTITHRNTGVRGNFIYVRQSSATPCTTTTVALAGGTPVTGGVVPMSGGATADVITTVRSILFSTWFHRIAVAHSDATNLAAWETHIDAVSGPLEGHPCQFIVGWNGAYSEVSPLAATTMNTGRGQMLWMLYGETPPSEMAASFAAERAVAEQGDPNRAYDNFPLRGVAPHSQSGDIPQRTTKVTALQNGVVPVTTEDNKALIVRSITTKCLLGSVPDYRTLDSNQVTVPDEIRGDIGILWTTEWVVGNPRVADDPQEGQPDRPRGVGTPTMWKQYAQARLKDWESGVAVSSGLPQIIDVDANPPLAGFDSIAKRIMSGLPVIPAPNQHQIGVQVQQVG